MKIPWSWLTSYCDPALDPVELAERLSMTGTEVERIGHSGAPSADGYVVGSLLAVESHPDADRLRVCTVDVGEGEPRTIVCGAPNVAAGQNVAVVLPGALLPGGTKLGKAKLRGVESSGMILSESELEIGDGHDGIAVLAGDLEAGTALADVIPVSEPVLELEITPNRPDCLGVYGVAREVHAITGAELKAEPWAQDAAATGEGDVNDYASVTVEVPDLCPRFSARVFTDIEIGPSPLWLKARLSAAGQRPINNVVDISNYVMLLTGQPVHAFDLDRVPGGELIVRTASAGEKMTTLDDVERSFDAETVLVCDRNGPSGVAGIMGGRFSEVSEQTTRVLLEVANWHGPNVLSTSAKLGLRSEASTRFEKQIHPALTIRAQAVCSQLLIELCAARMVAGTIDVDADSHPLRTLRLRAARTRALLGIEIADEPAAEYLSRLGFGVEDGGEELRIAVPADRHFDVTREVDLIEEVARVHGLDEHLPATLPERGEAVGGLAPYQRLLRRVEDQLRDLGLDEVIAWSFVPPDQGERLGDTGNAVRIHNPLSEEQSVMRRTLLGGLLDAAHHNLSRGADRLALFESGRVYLPEPPPADGGVLAGRFSGDRAAPVLEPQMIAALLLGSAGVPSWRPGAARQVDFFDIKGLIELIAAALRAEAGFEPVALPFLSPGRAATVSFAGIEAGWLGAIHPAVAKRWGIEGNLLAFELNAATLFAAASEGHEVFEDVTTFPAVHEDLAVVVSSEVPAETVRRTVLGAGGELLRSARVFDVYTGEQLEPGTHSLALRLEYRASDRTLTDAEVVERREAIVAALEQIGGVLRG